MATSEATTVREYLAELSPERREAIEAVRKAVLRALPKGYQEQMGHGMIEYVVPFTRLPKTYNKQPLQLAALASQKNYMALYLNNVYMDEALGKWFEEAYRATGKRFDMGKSCVRFKRLEDLPLDVVAEAIGRTSVEEFVAHYERVRAQAAQR